MGWRYWVGATATRVMDEVLSRAPIIRAVPTGHWPYDVRRFCGRRQIGPIFDVGANIGQTAASLVRYFPKDPIYCFEPVAKTFAVLEGRFGKRASCVRAALGAEAGTAQIGLYRDSELNTLAAPREDDDRRIGAETIDVLTLDEFCAERGVTAIGLLKMDVQGWELSVLDGARGMLDAGRISTVFCEVGFAQGGDDMLPFAAIHSRMQAEGFQFAGLYDQFRHGPAKQFVSFGNAMYVNPAATTAD